VNRIIVSLFGILISINATSQDFKYRKDDRPQNVKEDEYNFYQADRIDEIQLLKALEITGVRIFDIPISPAFEKEYKFTVVLDEYVESKKTKSLDITLSYQGKNTYVYFIDNDSVPYFDYIPKLTVFTQDKDTVQTLKIEYYGGSRSGIKLRENKLRDGQFYMWRAYSKTEWKLNEEIPLLVFASSWYDEKFKIERFCGVADLSMDEKKTKELLDSSPHYYVISLKISE